MYDWGIGKINATKSLAYLGLKTILMQQEYKA